MHCLPWLYKCLAWVSKCQLLVPIFLSFASWCLSWYCHGRHFWMRWRDSISLLLTICLGIQDHPNMGRFHPSYRETWILELTLLSLLTQLRQQWLSFCKEQLLIRELLWFPHPWCCWVTWPSGKKGCALKIYPSVLCHGTLPSVGLVGSSSSQVCYHCILSHWPSFRFGREASCRRIQCEGVTLSSLSLIYFWIYKIINHNYSIFHL